MFGTSRTDTAFVLSSEGAKIKNTNEGFVRSERDRKGMHFSWLPTHSSFPDLNIFDSLESFELFKDLRKKEHCKEPQVFL